MLRICYATLLGLLLAAAAWGSPVARFALVIPAGSPDPSPEKAITGYARVLDSVELPFAQLPADRLEKDLGQFPAFIVPAFSARWLPTSAIQQIAAAVQKGALLITEDDTPLSRALGIGFALEKIEVQQVEDARYPKVMTVWEKPAEMGRVIPPSGARVLVTEKWSGAPVMLTFAAGRGRVLFLATELDPLHGEGYARFPYFLHSLAADCDVRLPFRSPRLHAFFDYGFRSTVDLEYFARRWRRSGVLVLHASAWQFWDRTRDDYLRQLIAACHKNGILVYAWLELPHVSDEFWQKHPEWREKTATLADAKLDWRALVNLLDPAAFKEVSAGLLSLLADFDWDGVNVAELYFESPQGPSNPHRFTPFNDIVRAQFRAEAGVDPIDFFRKESPHYWEKDAAAWEKFVAYRSRLVAGLYDQVLGVVERARGSKPHLDTAVTFVDNLYDGKMREAIGTNVHLMLPLAARYGFNLIMEDPGTIWSHGPARYQMLGERYREIGPKTRWGIDINVVDRYQEVFPTKKQTGTEFLELFHFAGQYFPVVLVYFEQSIYAQDLEMVAHALAAGARVVEESGGKITTESPAPVSFRPDGGAGARLMVNGAEWPAREGDEVTLPAGRHTVQVAPGNPAAVRLNKLTANLVSAAYDGPRAIRFAYESRPRAIAVFSSRPARVVVDGAAFNAGTAEFYGEFSVLLPPGSHQVRVEF